MSDITLFPIREKQIACARCNFVSLDERLGAFGFESDHVDENFPKKGEKKEKEFDLAVGKCCSIMRLLEEEDAKTQIRLVFCNYIHLFIYVCLTSPRIRCPHVHPRRHPRPRQPSLPASIATLLSNVTNNGVLIIKKK